MGKQLTLIFRKKIKIEMLLLRISLKHLNCDFQCIFNMAFNENKLLTNILITIFSKINKQNI